MSQDFNLKQSIGELLITSHQTVAATAQPLKTKLDSLLKNEPSIHHADIKKQFVKKLNTEITSILHAKIADKANYDDILSVIQTVPMPVALGYYSDREYENEFRGCL